jgi:hypothetical protein
VAATLGIENNTAYVARRKVQRMIREIVDRLEGPLTPFRTDAGAGNEEHETTDVRPRLPR